MILVKRLITGPPPLQVGNEWMRLKKSKQPAESQQQIMSAETQDSVEEERKYRERVDEALDLQR